MSGERSWPNVIANGDRTRVHGQIYLADLPAVRRTRRGEGLSTARGAGGSRASRPQATIASVSAARWADPRAPRPTRGAPAWTAPSRRLATFDRGRDRYAHKRSVELAR